MRKLKYYTYNGFHYITLPGVIVHELSHVLAVLLMPNIKIKDIDLTSHVTHYGHYNFKRLFFISYAPFLFNTIIAFLIARFTETITLTEFEHYILFILLVYLSISIASRSLPSYSDAISPFFAIKNKLKSIKIIITFPILILLTIISLPGLILAYSMEKITILGIMLSILFSIIVFSIGFGILEIEYIFNIL